MGDGYTMFADNTFLQDSVMLDNQVLITYITDYLGGVVGAEYSNPYGQGRIVAVEAPVVEEPAEEEAVEETVEETVETTEEAPVEEPAA